MPNIVGILVIVVVWLACEISKEPPSCMVQASGIQMPSEEK